MARHEVREGGGARSLLLRFLRDQSGATAIEYAMIGGLIFAVAAGAIRLYGSRISDVYARIGDTVSQAN